MMFNVSKYQKIEYECPHITHEGAPKLWFHKMGYNTWLVLCPHCREELRAIFFSETIERAIRDGLSQNGAWRDANNT